MTTDDFFLSIVCIFRGFRWKMAPILDLYVLLMYDYNHISKILSMRILYETFRKSTWPNSKLTSGIHGSIFHDDDLSLSPVQRDGHLADPRTLHHCNKANENISIVFCVTSPPHPNHSKQ